MNWRTGESAAGHAVRMFIVPITLFSCASRGYAETELTVSRVSMTVSISAARTIRASRLCWFETFTNSVRSSSTLGSSESTPMIVSTSSNASSACASRPPQYVERPVRRTIARLAHPNHTLFRLPSISWRFSWIRARTSWATVWTSALSCAAS